MDSSIFLTNFTHADWAIVIVYLGATVAKGVWVNRYVGDLSDFIIAGRGLRIYLAVATMTGTEIGLVTVMYNAQEGFSSGPSAFIIGICWLVGMLVVGLTGFIIYPLRQFAVMTIPEYYELRFGRRSRVVGGAILALAGILNMGLFLQAGARFMRGVLGVESELGLKLLMTIMLGMVLLYTTFGGMVSVVITDYMQFVVLGVAMVVGTVWIVMHLGWENIVQAAVEQHGAGAVNPFHEGGYGPWYIVWMIYMGVAAGSLWATATTRALAAHSPQTAQRLYKWSSITFLSRVIIPVTWGAAALCFITQTPELTQAFLGEGAPAEAGQYAMPVFFARFFPTGFLGIIAAGMMAGFMSTHDSYLLCWASVITQDVVAPFYKVGNRGRQVAGIVAGVLGGVVVAGIVSWAFGRLAPQFAGLIGAVAGVPVALWLARRIPKVFEGEDLTERGRFILTRTLICLIGFFLLFWGLWYEAQMTLWTYMAVTGTIYLSGAFVCIAAGLYWKGATERGALIALCGGLLALLGIVPWKDWNVTWVTETSLERFVDPTNLAVITIALAAAGMLAGSLLWRSKPDAAPADEEADQ